MDKEGLRTLVFIAAGTMIGAFLRNMFQNGQKPSLQLAARSVLLIIIVAVLGFFTLKKIK